MNTKIVASTPLGPVALVWEGLPGGPRILRVLLSKPGEPAPAQVAALYPDVRTGSCREIDDLAASIGRFLRGEPIRFSLDLAAIDTRPAFQQAVLRAEHAIPRGRVSAYGLIAAHLGDRRAARAVGHALATNPFPLIVPCHRAVQADGGLGGFQGGPAMKRALLEREGVPFDGAGRVAVARFHYS
ncbi:MAG TPA: methylated-DNA--[protein]-cysteine S-methyltransferase [Candidatus Bathyarchaeia archaeon]|nr:methylated-DNA--[protein]-cysteine S-methyltransferase [Candidatus Bathyarchaeia archaeon]